MYVRNAPHPTRQKRRWQVIPVVIAQIRAVGVAYGPIVADKVIENQVVFVIIKMLRTKAAHPREVSPPIKQKAGNSIEDIISCRDNDKCSEYTGRTPNGKRK